jgi:hypothetical protein
MGTTAIIFAALGAASAVQQADSARKANHSRQQGNAIRAKANDQARKQADITNLRNRRQAARAAVSARSQVVAASAGSGDVVTTAAAGQQGSAITEGAGNISFLDTVASSQRKQADLNAQATQLFGDATNAANRFDVFGAAAPIVAGASNLKK